MSTHLTIYLDDDNEARLRRLSVERGFSAEVLATAAVEAMLATRPTAPKLPHSYKCPVCHLNDGTAYLRCNRPDCTDGRDPR